MKPYFELGTLRRTMGGGHRPAELRASGLRRALRGQDAFFSSKTLPFRAGENRPGGGGNVWGFNCEPVVAAGQALLVDDDFALDNTLWLTPTPGHSPYHCCVNIRSRGQYAVVVGDLMHPRPAGSRAGPVDRV